METTIPRLITAEEFSNLPEPDDGTLQELVKGVIETMPMPNFQHGECQVAVAFLLHQYAKANRAGRVVTETGVLTERNPDTVRGPDVSFWSAARLPLDEVVKGYPQIAPDLCVEVLSPSNTAKQIKQKIKEYLFNGTKAVWIVDPADRSMKIYRSPLESRSLEEDAFLDGEDILPGFRCKVAELFG
ncbi:MAG: Uma2 family endonuclease [Planctomycetes bacterium]|nr:Uma2 family endonuclease [Planctomycetota bacterium]